MKSLIQIATAASVACAGLAATPAMAQSYDRYGNYYGDSRYDSRYDRRYDDRYADRRYAADGRYYDYRDNRDVQRCRRSSGTTGAILGAIAGGLLGREIGRGGWGNRPSTTGLIIGAGAGALAGREIDKSANCNPRRR
jgi:hypothetical protein